MKGSTKSGPTTVRRFTAVTLSCIALGLVFALTGCGKLDMEVLSKSILEGLASELGLKIASVTCPPEWRAAKAGDTFECEAYPKEGGRLVVKVTQKDDQSNVRWDVVRSEGWIILKTAEEAISKALKHEADVDVTVSCGDGARVRAAKTGETFECTVTNLANGTTSTFTVTAQDSEDKISWVVK